MLKNKYLLFVSIVTLLLLLAGCVEGENLSEENVGDATNTSSQDSNGNNNSNGDNGEDNEDIMFTIARAAEAEIMDPNNATAEGDIDIVFHMFDGLVQYKNAELDVEPALATDWERSEDGLTWSFNLRDDVEFHDGSQFNADSVVQSFMRIIDEEHEYFGMIQGSYSYLDYLMGGVIDEVVEVGEYEVEFHLNQRFAPFLTYMGYYSQFIVSPTALAEKGEDFLNHPIGTGPFKFDEWQRGEYVRLKVNENYWGDIPEIDTLVFKVVPESSTRYLELQAGSVDAIKNVDPSQMSSIDENEDLFMESVAGTNLFFAALNTEAEPFDDENVRKAVNHAVNMEVLVDHIYQGSGTRAINFLPPSLFSFDATAGPYEYNIEKAKQLMAEAGLEDGFEMELHTFNAARSYVSQPVQAAELIAGDLSDIGIDVEIVTNEWASHAAIMNSSEHQMALTGWFDIGYPSNFLKTLALEGSRTNYNPEELQELALAAWDTYDQAEQAEIYTTMQHDLHDAAPIIPIAHNNYSIAVRNNVIGFEVDVLGVVRAHEVKFE